MGDVKVEVHDVIEGEAAAHMLAAIAGQSVPQQEVLVRTREEINADNRAFCLDRAMGCLKDAEVAESDEGADECVRMAEAYTALAEALRP